jgi:hypothetical protein
VDKLWAVLVRIDVVSPHRDYAAISTQETTKQHRLSIEMYPRLKGRRRPVPFIHWKKTDDNSQKRRRAEVLSPLSPNINTLAYRTVQHRNAIDLFVALI